MAQVDRSLEELGLIWAELPPRPIGYFFKLPTSPLQLPQKFLSSLESIGDPAIY
ncbi:MAG TPA: hypothetical protein V6C57_01740 [Coleofasciculaceae cyanobacterium]